MNQPNSKSLMNPLPAV